MTISKIFTFLPKAFWVALVMFLIVSAAGKYIFSLEYPFIAGLVSFSMAYTDLRIKEESKQ